MTGKNIESKLAIVSKADKKTFSDGVFPEERFPDKGRYKVMQFKDGQNGLPYLRFGALEDLHIDIKSGFEQEYRLAGEKTDEFEHYEFGVEGAGKCHVDPSEKTASFYGESTGFKIGINKDHLKELNEIYSDWTFKTE